MHHLTDEGTGFCMRKAISSLERNVTMQVGGVVK